MRAVIVSRPKRLSSHSYVGRARYFLTFCTHERLKALADSEVAARTLEQFRHTAAIERFAILAYCLMPDHVHLLENPFRAGLGEGYPHIG